MRADEKLPWGEIRRRIYRPVKRHAGIFSLCSTSLLDLGSAHVAVQSVVARRAFHEFRSLPGVNSWSVFFQQPDPALNQPEAHPYLETLRHHESYHGLDFGVIQPFLDHYFRPSRRVRARVKYFQQRYALDPENLIAVNIRGTDKYTEVPPAPVENYLELAVRAKNNARNSGILLVTDQAQFITPFRSEFGSQLVVLDELPTTTTNESIHPSLKVRQRQRFGVNFMAAIRIIASSQSVITHTGNGAFWTALFRGNATGLVQLKGSEQYGDV